MSDVPPLLEPVPHRRHWLEYVATGAALLLSAVSLWVAIGTMDANTKMVQAASWPFLQLDSSNALGTPDKRQIMFSVTNSGVGPAKVESFEMFWKGKPVRRSRDLILRCCGPEHDPPLTRGPWTNGTIGGTVIRAGESRMFITYDETPDNKASWDALDQARLKELVFRICYCSVFDECFRTDFNALHPARVDRCPVPAAPYKD
jgi:hypothetical protein